VVATFILESEMSFQAMAWAVRQKAPTKPKFVLLMLANYADENGRAWPALGTLCRETGIGRSTMIECLKKLVELGLIEKAERHKGNLRISNVYTLKVPLFP